MEDLTIASFAYLRLPLLVAALAFLVGAAGTFRAKAQRAFLAVSYTHLDVYKRQIPNRSGTQRLLLDERLFDESPVRMEDLYPIVHAIADIQ